MSIPVDQSPKVTFATIGVFGGLVLNLLGLIGLAVAIGQWKGEVTASLDQARENDTAQLNRLVDLEVRVRRSEGLSERVDERMKNMEQSLSEIKTLVRNGFGK